MAEGFDPRSGEGARIQGGRFTPRGSFPTLYLCLTRPCVVAELLHTTARQGLALSDLLPRGLYRFQADLSTVLDLDDADVRHGLGVTLEDLTGPQWAIPQAVGEAAYQLGHQGIRCPSATGVGHVLAVYTEHLGLSHLAVDLAETWSRMSDVADEAPSEQQ